MKSEMIDALQRAEPWSRKMGGAVESRLKIYTRLVHNKVFNIDTIKAAFSRPPNHRGGFQAEVNLIKHPTLHPHQTPQRHPPPQSVQMMEADRKHALSTYANQND